MIFGNTHKQLLRITDESIIVNPGSVGFPARGLKFATGVLLDTRKKNVETLEVLYDKSELLQRLKALNYPEHYISRVEAVHSMPGSNGE